jgi:hypothetical protein
MWLYFCYVIFFLSTFHTLTECAIKILLWALMKAHWLYMLAYLREQSLTHYFLIIGLIVAVWHDSVYCSLNLSLSICFLHEHPLHFECQSFATEYVLQGGKKLIMLQGLAKSFSNYHDEVLVCLPTIWCKLTSLELSCNTWCKAF